MMSYSVFLAPFLVSTISRVKYLAANFVTQCLSELFVSKKQLLFVDRNSVNERSESEAKQ